MVEYKVIDTNGNKTKVQNIFTSEIKEYTYSELAKLNQKVYNTEFTDIQGLFCYGKSTEGKITRTITDIVPVSKLDDFGRKIIEPSDIPLCALTHIPCTNVATSGFASNGLYVASKNIKEGKQCILKNIDCCYNASLLLFHRPLSIEYGTVLGNTQYISKFSDGIYFYPYLPIKFSLKKGINSIIYCLDNQFTPKHISIIELYKILLSYEDREFQWSCGNYLNKYQRENGGYLGLSTFLQDLNFSPIWMIDSTHIAIKFPNNISVIDLSEYILNKNKPNDEKQQRADDIRYKMTSTYNTLEQVVVKNNTLLRGIGRAVEDQNASIYDLPPQVTVLERKSIYIEKDGGIYLTINIPTTVEKISSHCVYNKVGVVVYMKFPFTLPFNFYMRCILDFIPKLTLQKCNVAFSDSSSTIIYKDNKYTVNNKKTILRLSYLYMSCILSNKINEIAYVPILDYIIEPSYSIRTTDEIYTDDEKQIIYLTLRVIMKNIKYINDTDRLNKLLLQYNNIIKNKAIDLIAILERLLIASNHNSLSKKEIDKQIKKALGLKIKDTYVNVIYFYVNSLTTFSLMSLLKDAIREDIPFILEIAPYYGIELNKQVDEYYKNMEYLARKVNAPMDIMNEIEMEHQILTELSNIEEIKQISNLLDELYNALI